MLCLNKTKNITAVENVEAARSFWARLKGLLGRRGMEESSGLLLDPCNSVHTMFMKFTIDAVFLDENGMVLHIEHKLKPWRFSKMVWRARRVLELPSGYAQSRFETGDEVVFE